MDVFLLIVWVWEKLSPHFQLSNIMKTETEMYWFFVLKIE